MLGGHIMFPTRRVTQTLVIAGALLLWAPLARVGWAQNLYNSTYFDVAPDPTYPINGAGLPTGGGSIPAHDNTVRLVNPTFHTNDIVVPGDTPSVSGGGLCAMIYVYDDDEQPQECCGCPISNDGDLTLSVEKDLIGNGATGTSFNHGVIEVVSADPNGGTGVNFCDPTGNTGAIVPDATIRSWITHIPVEIGGPTLGVSALQNITEVEFLATTLDSATLGGLEGDCGIIVSGGSGRGVCSCGTADGPPTSSTSTTTTSTSID